MELYAAKRDIGNGHNKCDEGSRCTAEDFYRRLSKAFEEGADIVDIGACSTRPGSTPLSPEEEWANLAAVLGKVNDYFRRSVPL